VASPPTQTSFHLMFTSGKILKIIVKSKNITVSEINPLARSNKKIGIEIKFSLILLLIKERIALITNETNSRNPVVKIKAND